MVDATLETYAGRRAGALSRPSPAPMARLAGLVKTAAVIVGLMALASVPMVLRLWFYFPSIHNG